MPTFRLIETEAPTRETLERLAQGVSEHAQAVIGDSGFHPIAVFAKDEDGTLAGGVSGSLNWTWLSIKLLWVREDARGTGLGRRLMEAIEELARRRGCVQAHVDTLGFQAPAFYRHLGYEAFAELPDYAPGHGRIYLRKTLQIDATARPQWQLPDPPRS
jgi:GNAT superfamily N-acetyltransferase